LESRELKEYEVFEWFSKFISAILYVEDYEVPGHPLVKKTNEHVE
jgi:hypothetical protein